MPPSETPDSALRALAQHDQAFCDDCAGRFEGGAALARADGARLTRLADRLAADLRDWSAAAASLEVGAEARIDPARAGHLVIETVFDEALSATACRLLAAALALALSRS